MSIKTICEKFGLSSDLGSTAAKTFVEKEASAFDQQGIGNRVNTPWKRAENIIIKDDGRLSKADLLQNWKALTGAGSYPGQYLYFPSSSDIYEMYDAKGNLVDSGKLSELFEQHNIGKKIGMEEAFKRWLSKNGVPSAAKSSYVDHLRALGEPIGNHTPTGRWPGFFEYLTGVRPSKGVYDVADLAEFDRIYGLANDYFYTDSQTCTSYGANYSQCYAYSHDRNGGDQRTLLNAYKKYREFLASLSWEEYLAAIRTKPFILLAGISGTGKSRIVRQLARGCCPEKKDGQPHPLRDEQKPGNYELIPVRPNWHDSTELMGYVTRITSDKQPKYVLTPFVKFLVKAWLHKDVPFFLCLDEMNLAPVEQYFAEYLSKIETRKLSGGDIVTDVLVEFTDEVCASAIEELLKPYKPAAGSPIPPEVTALENAMRADKGIRIPSNLVVMGTVNMDETTCSFSRKVLDRAMSFELNDVEDMYTISEDGDPDVTWGAFNNGVVNRAKQTYVTAENLYAETDATKKAANMAIGEKVLAYLKEVNDVLDKTPFKVAYRTRNEMMLYCVERGGDLAKALDEVTSMKILSRIEGDENAVRVTNKMVESAAVVQDPLSNDAPKSLIQLLKRVILKQLGVVDGTLTSAAAAPSLQDYETLKGKYKICAAKLDEMNDRLLCGYTGFWR